MRGSKLKHSVPRVLGLLPARGGSKGLPGKNLMEIGGKPIIGWAANALLGSPLVTVAVCSTESAEIAAVARKMGLQVPFTRPKELADDTALVRDVILHALEVLSEQRIEDFEYVALVQATSPTVTRLDVDSAIDLCVAKNFDTVVTARATPHAFHPAMMFSSVDQKVESWFSGSDLAAGRRQAWPKVYVRTGLVYVFKVSFLLSNASFYAGSTGFIEVEGERAISIDDWHDFILAKDYLEKGSQT